MISDICYLFALLLPRVMHEGNTSVSKMKQDVYNVILWEQVI